MYPTDIPGLRFVSRAQEPATLRAVLSADTPRQAIVRLVRELPAKTTLYFFDPHHPSPSDPGAYVSVRLRNGLHTYGVANHGWSADRRITSPELMIEYLFMNRAANSDFDRACVEVSED